MAFAPDGMTVATDALSADVKIIFWDARTGKELRRTEVHGPGSVHSVAFCPKNGKILASGNSDKTVSIWEVATGKRLHRLEGHDHSVSAVAISPNGETLASGDEGGVIRLWHAATGELHQHAKTAHIAIGRLAFSPDGKRLASVGAGGAVCLWDTQTLKLVRTWETHATFNWACHSHRMARLSPWLARPHPSAYGIRKQAGK